MREPIKGFDGIRGLAVISVVCTHLGIWKSWEDTGLLSPSVTPLIHGSTAVEAFFVLSGFLITTLLMQEHVSTGHISIKNFMIRRALKIFPLYAFFLLIATALHVTGTHVTTWTSLRYAYFYLYNFIPYNLCTGFLEHTWSLAVEEHFYLLWPALFSIMFPARMGVAIRLLAISIPISLFLHFMFVTNGFTSEYWVSRWTFISGYSIAAGCLAAFLVNQHKPVSTIQSLITTPFGFFAGVLLYANSLYLHTGHSFIDTIASEYLRTLGITLLIAWIFLHQDNLITTLLEFRPLKYIGIISYGIYIYQGLFLATGPQRSPLSEWPPDQSMGILLLIVAAPLSYHLFEKPFLSLKSKFTSPSLLCVTRLERCDLSPR